MDKWALDDPYQTFRYFLTTVCPSKPIPSPTAPLPPPVPSSPSSPHPLAAKQTPLNISHPACEASSAHQNVSLKRKRNSLPDITALQDSNPDSTILWQDIGAGPSGSSSHTTSKRQKTNVKKPAIQITKKEYVSKVEHLDNVPVAFEIPLEPTAYLVDLSAGNDSTTSKVSTFIRQEVSIALQHISIHGAEYIL
jgi:hypothetical protein